MKNMIEFRNVSKKLGGKQVVSGVELTVGAGEVIGIVGANGSGKTTLLRMVTGLIYADQGEVRVGDKQVRPGLMGHLPVSVGALIESPSFLPNFSGLRNLTLLADIREKVKAPQVRETMARVGLDPDNKKGVKSYSLGMRQRLGIAQAVMESPEVLVFDEPTSGLDQDGVKMFENMLQEQVQRGVAVIMVSHVQEEINRFCDRVFMIREGRLEPLRQLRERQWVILAKSLEDLEVIHEQIPSFEMSKRVDGYPAGICNGQWSNKEELEDFLEGSGVRPVEIREVS
jgi:ABC-2 type transport system ATP-binding protein